MSSRLAQRPMRNFGLSLALLATVQAAERSPFEQLIDTTDYVCNHLVLRSSCNDAELRGLVIFFHGFSACSSQILKLAPDLNAKCLDVLAPTMPGHGERPVSHCDAPGAHCSVRWKNGTQGFDLRRLPTRAEEYADFVETINKVVQAEREFRAKAVGKEPQALTLGAMGLSFGATLAVSAATKAQGQYTHLLKLNPSFGGGVEKIDEDLVECQAAVGRGQKTPQDCLKQLVSGWSLELGGGGGSLDFVLELLVPRRLSPGQYERDLSTRMHLLSQYWVGAPESRSVQGALEQMLSKQQVWDDVCPKIFAVQPPRSGFCMFLFKHLLATNSFSLSALVDSVRAYDGQYLKFPVSQAIVTERDGLTRNGLTYQVLSQFELHSQAPAAAACMYRFRRGTNRGDPAQYWSNDNSMPHANLDQADSPGQVMWWEPSLFTRIRRFLLGNTTVSGPETWAGSRDECVNEPLGADAFARQPWLEEAVLPEAAPLTADELLPDELWNTQILKFDNLARVWCKDPVIKQKIATFVNCSIFGVSSSDLVFV